MFGSAEEFEAMRKERDDATRHASELLEQIEAMDSASRILLQVATASDGEVQIRPASFSGRCDDEIREDRSSDRSHLTSNDAEKTFEDMQKQWKLEQTGFPSLFSACKMLQQSKHLLAEETDHALDEMKSAQEAKAVMKKKLSKSKKALRVVWKENGELRKENARLREIIRRMGEEQGEQLDQVYAILAHEEVLSPSISPNCDDSQDFSSMSSPPLTPSPSKSFDDDESIHLPSPFKSDDENDVPELTSPPRIIKSSATLQFKDATPGVGDLISRWMNKKDQQRGAYKITFPNSKEIGLKMHSMPIRPPPPGASKEAEDYIPRVPLVGIQIDVNKLLRRNPDAFIVWGFQDVDTCCSDSRPTIGARLIAVDGSPCENGQWGTLHDLCKRVRTKRGPVTLTFRNDPVTQDQIDHLNRVLTPRVKGKGAKNKSTTVDMTKSPEKRQLFRV